jgi:hypothetical protein
MERSTLKCSYQVKISNRITALKNLDDNVDINGGWESITENIKISGEESLGYYELQSVLSIISKEEDYTAMVVEFKPNEWR